MDSVEVALVASPFANLTPLYEVDPDADVLLIVPPSKQAFAPWDAPQQHHDHANGVNRVNGVRNPTAAAAPASRPGLRIKVSSKHLTLASRVFRNKLQFSSTRAARQSDGRVHLQLAEGFDAKAVSIVLNALHGRGSKVPKSVDLDTLARIALFVDRFQLLDAVEVYAERWIRRLAPEDTISRDAHDRDLVLWIYASHVFRDANAFRAATRAAATRSAGPLPTLGLPIREKIIKHINTQRQSLLASALSLVHSTLDDLTAPSTPCTTRHCDALLLGALIQALHRHRLVWPRPAAPFPELSFVALVEAVGDAKAAVGGLSGAGVGQGLREEVEPWDRARGGEKNGVGKRLFGANGGVVNGRDKERVNGNGSGNGLWAKDREDGKKPSGWGAVGGDFPLTPIASPEPVYRSVPGAGGAEHVHECDARKVVGRLEELAGLADEVQGLVLESELGYQLY